MQAQYGGGYTLTLALDLARLSQATAAIGALLHQHVPHSALLRRAGGEVAYRLPLSQEAAFAGLLQALDDDKDR